MGQKCLVKTLLGSTKVCLVFQIWRPGRLEPCQTLSKGGPVSLALVSFSSCLIHWARELCFVKDETWLAVWTLWILSHQKSYVLGVSIGGERPVPPDSNACSSVTDAIPILHTEVRPRELCGGTFLL